MEKEHPFYMVYVQGEHTPTYQHEELTSAENEAQRLTELTGKKAYVLATVKSYLIDKFKVTDCRPNNENTINDKKRVV